jgi:hypothetical protein
MTSRVTNPQASAIATEKLIAVLEATRAKLMTHAEPEHRFRFVSAAQSLPNSDIWFFAMIILGYGLLQPGG